MNSKKETLSEFLFRGGVIKILPLVREKEAKNPIRKTTIEPVSLMSLEEAEFFYSKSKQNPKKAKKATSSPIDLKALPETLRSKLILKLQKEGYNV